MKRIINFIHIVYLLPVYFYRKFISPIKPPCCRFTPTCSVYCIQAIKEWGIIVGSCLTIWRIFRCNPFSKGGEDPVPLRKTEEKIERHKYNFSKNIP